MYRLGYGGMLYMRGYGSMLRMMGYVLGWNMDWSAHMEDR